MAKQQVVFFVYRVSPLEVVIYLYLNKKDLAESPKFNFVVQAACDCNFPQIHEIKWNNFSLMVLYIVIAQVYKLHRTSNPENSEKSILANHK